MRGILRDVLPRFQLRAKFPHFTRQMIRENKRPVILLAEDSEDDVFFFRWVARKAAQDLAIVCVPDGKEAVRLLAAGMDASGHRTPQCPDMVFLDLKMPMYSGFEVLEWMRNHPVTPPVPVAVLSGSDNTADIEQATRFGASAYFTKPISAPKLAEWLFVWRKTCRPQEDAGHDSAPPGTGPAVV